jgi:hypothetical protein
LKEGQLGAGQQIGLEIEEKAAKEWIMKFTNLSTC